MLIGFAGIMSSGKDTAANFLCKNHNFVRVAFADALKRAVGEVFDFSDEQLWGKKREEPDTRYVREIIDGKAVYLTPRFALQWIGTEGYRTCCHDIWTLKTLATAKKLMATACAYSPRRGISQTVTVSPAWSGIAIPDLRFKNEHILLRNAGGVLVRLKREVAANQSGISGHQSEQELSQIPDSFYDYVIDNQNITLAELEAAVSKIFYKQRDLLNSEHAAHP